MNFVIFWPQIVWRYIDSGYLVSATPYTISYLSLCNFAHLFFHGLKMCMWFEFNPGVNFCHFSIFLTLSFFKFSQVRHQLHRSSIYILYFALPFLIVISLQCFCNYCKWAPSSEFVSSSIPSWQILTAHAQTFRGVRDLAFCLKVPLDSLLLWASSEGSGETARMRRLAWTFAARIGYKYQIRLTRSK